MAAKAFDTPIADDGVSLAGPWRAPQQMLAAQAEFVAQSGDTLIIETPGGGGHGTPTR